MPEWPGAVFTRLSLAWQEVQLVQPARGWPIGGTLAVPTPPAAVVWQPRQSAPAGISSVRARAGAAGDAPGPAAEGPGVVAEPGDTAGAGAAVEPGPAVEPGADDAVPGADVATGRPATRESISLELMIPRPTAAPIATAATTATTARKTPRLRRALTARLPCHHAARPGRRPASGRRPEPGR